MGVFEKATDFLDAVDAVHDHALYGMETYTPLRVDELPPLMGRGKSPVRYWTLFGALSGLTGGFALAIGSALVEGLIVGGKHPISIVPYCVVGFEGTILLGALGNFIGMLVNARLPKWKTPPGYDWRFSQDKFGLFVASPPGQFEGLRQVLESAHPEEVHDVQ